MTAGAWLTWQGFALLNAGMITAYYVGQLVERDRQHERNARRRSHQHNTRKEHN
jgi:hypothetical protein